MTKVRVMVIDLLQKMIEMHSSGYDVVEIGIFEGDEEFKPALCFDGLECAGLGAVDFESLDDLPDSVISHIDDDGDLNFYNHVPNGFEIVPKTVINYEFEKRVLPVGIFENDERK